MGQSENCRNSIWQNKAVAFAVRTRQEIWGKHSADIQATMFLNGFSIEYIKKALLGWQSKPVFRKLESWGVEPEGLEAEGGKGRFAIPVGIVVPYVVDTLLRRVSVITLSGDDFGRTYNLPGSCMESVVLGAGKKRVAVVESLVDALLLHQEAGNRIDILVPELVSGGRLDKRATEALEGAEKVLIIKDAAQTPGEDTNLFSDLSVGSLEVVTLKGGVVQAFKSGAGIKGL